MRFTIGFEKEDRKKLHSYWDEIIQSERWSEGKFTEQFEVKWAGYNNSFAVAFSSWGGAAMAALEYFGVKGKTVLSPANTFVATPLSVTKVGGRLGFVDCNKEDLCVSLDDLKQKIGSSKPTALWVVHIGGHIAFQINEITKLCKEEGITLLEDCAHAHGASWNGIRAGSWGDAGIYSFYATKTISTGEGGMLVTSNKDLAEFAREYRNYGKPSFNVQGLNFRLSEFSAAIGCVQVDRLDEIVAWKNEYAQKHLDPHYPHRVKFPDGMRSGYYKYIVFEPVEKSTGKVYDTPCHRVFNPETNLPNTEWVARNHW